MPEPKGFIAALIAALRAPRGQDAEASRAVAEEASKKLPGAVMPRKAIERKREELREIDALLKE